MGFISYLSQAVYWIAKVYFMFFGILYILALLGKFSMDRMQNIDMNGRMMRCLHVVQ